GRHWRSHVPGKRPLPLGRVRADTDNLLAEVLASQQADQFAGGVLQSIRDVFAVLDLAVPQPAAHVGDEIAELGAVVKDDETPEGQPLGEDIPHEQRHAVRSGWQLGRVVVSDEAAHRDTGKLLSSGSTASNTAPPTFSKSMSMPFGQAAWR